MEPPVPGAVALTGRAGPRRRPAAAPVAATLLAVVVAVIVLTPLGFLAWRTFLGGDGAGFDAVRRAWAGPGTFALATRSAIFAVGAALGAALIGGVLAYLVARTDLPGRRVVVTLTLIPLVVPGMLYAFAWVLLTSPRIGALSGPFGDLPDRLGVDPFTLQGMIWVESLHLSPVAFLLLYVAFRSIDPSLEEAAQVAGLRRGQTIRHVTLPLVRPAIATTLLLVGLRAIESFEVPALLGLPGGVSVLTTRLFELLRSFPPDPAAAGSMGILLVGVAVLGLAFHHTALRRSDAFQVVTPDRRAGNSLQLGRARPVVVAVLACWFALVVVAPIAILVWASLLPHYRRPGRAALDGVGLDTYRRLLDESTLSDAVGRSLVLGAAAATIAVLLGALVAWVVVRTRVRGRFLLDAVVLTPLVIPGLVLGLAIGFVWLRVPLPVYGTSTILLVAYVTNFLPHGSRYAAAALAAVRPELEEAARVNGATRWSTLRLVVLPLAGPGLAAAWLTILVLSLREISLSLLLYAPGEEVVPVLLWERWEDGRLTDVAALGLLIVALIVVVLAVAYRAGRRSIAPALT